MPHVSYHIGGLHAILKKEKPSSVCLVTSKKVASGLASHIRKVGIPKSRVLFVPDGEKAKEWDVLEKLLKGFSRVSLDRSSIVIAFGGGTVGDLVGFAASIYLRGVKCIQVPTTLVSQVDSAHGGKTGINFAGYKNQIGTIRQPIAIIADYRLLRSLPVPQIIDGLGEIIKCGLIKDVSILSFLKNETASSLSRSKRLPSLIRKAIAVKSFYTDADLVDAGLRNMLNFGHTAGHAIELANGLSHGHAVIIGMLKELSFTEKLGLTTPAVRRNLIDLLNQLGISHQGDYAPDMRAVLHDKKISGGTIALPVVLKEGSSKLVTMDAKLLKGLFK